MSGLPLRPYSGPRARHDLAQLLDQVSRRYRSVADESVEKVADVTEQQLEPRALVNIGTGHSRARPCEHGPASHHRRPVAIASSGRQLSAALLKSPAGISGSAAGDGLGIVLRPARQLASKHDEMLDAIEAERLDGLAALAPSEARTNTERSESVLGSWPISAMARRSRWRTQRTRDHRQRKRCATRAPPRRWPRVEHAAQLFVVEQERSRPRRSASVGLIALDDAEDGAR